MRLWCPAGRFVFVPQLWMIGSCVCSAQLGGLFYSPVMDDWFMRLWYPAGRLFCSSVLDDDLTWDTQLGGCFLSLVGCFDSPTGQPFIITFLNDLISLPFLSVPSLFRLH